MDASEVWARTLDQERLTHGSASEVITHDAAASDRSHSTDTVGRIKPVNRHAADCLVNPQRGRVAYVADPDPGERRPKDPHSRVRHRRRRGLL